MVANTREVVIRFKLEADRGNGEVARQIARQTQQAVGGAVGRPGAGPWAGGTAWDEAKAKRQERADAYQFKEAMRRISDREKAEKKAAQAIERELESAGTAYTRMAQRAQMSSVRMVRNLTWIGDSVLGLTKGIAMLGASGEKDMEKLVRSLVKIQAYYDIFRDAAGIVISATRAWVSYKRAVEQAAAAHAVLAAAEAASGTTGAGGAASTAAAAAVGTQLPRAAGVAQGVGSASRFGAAGAAAVGATAAVLTGYQFVRDWRKYGFGGGATPGSASEWIAGQEADTLAWISGKLGHKHQDFATYQLSKERVARQEQAVTADMEVRARHGAVVEAGIAGRAQIEDIRFAGAERRRQVAVGGLFAGRERALLGAGSTAEYGLHKAERLADIASGRLGEAGGWAGMKAASAERQRALAAMQQVAFSRAGVSEAKGIAGLGLGEAGAGLASASREMAAAKANITAAGGAERYAEAEQKVAKAIERVTAMEEKRMDVVRQSTQQRIAATLATLQGLEQEQRKQEGVAEAARGERISGAAAFGALTGGQQKRLLRLKAKGLAAVSRAELNELAAAGVEGAREEQARRGESAGFGTLRPELAQREREASALAGALEVKIRDQRQLAVTLEADVQAMAQTVMEQLQPMLREKDRLLIAAVRDAIAKQEQSAVTRDYTKSTTGQSN